MQDMEENEEGGGKRARSSWEKRQRLLLRDRFDVRVSFGFILIQYKPLIKSPLIKLIRL